MLAQSVAPKPRLRFDVASVHEWGPNQGPRGHYIAGIQVSPGRIFSQCAGLGVLVRFAYHFEGAERIEGLPKWAKTMCADSDSPGMYVTTATMPVGTTNAQAREMMQSLLADRFKLAAHWTTRPTSGFALEIAPGGFKLQSSDAAKDPPVKPHSIGCPAADRHCNIGLCCGLSSALSDVCWTLTDALGKPVIDKTGLVGTYPFGVMLWRGDDSTDSPLPSLPTLLRDQYGLVLKSGTVPVRVLVIDHAEPLTPN